MTLTFCFCVDCIRSNVMASVDLGVKVDLLRVAAMGRNVEHGRNQPHLSMQLRNPRCTASVTSSGKVVRSSLAFSI